MLLAWWFRQPAISALIVLTVMATAFFVVEAATLEWANVGTTWSSGSNWVGGTAPANSTVTDVASFGSTGASAINPNLTTQSSISGITFQSGAFSYIVGGSIVTIGSNGISNSAANTETFSNGIRTSASQTWTTNSGGTLVLSSTVDIVNSGSSTRTLTVNGAGNTTFNGVVQNLGAGSTGILAYTGTGFLTLAGTNTFTGGVTVSSGTLNINNAAALGTGTFTISGGSIDNTSGGAIGPLTNNNPQTWSGNFTFIGTNNLNLGTGAVSLGTTAGTTRTITTSAGTLTIGGVISNGTTANSLTKTSLGTLILSGANSYTGTTTISAGTLTLGASGVLADGSNMILSGGTFSTGASTGFTETLDTLGLTNDSVISLGVGSHTLTFAASNGVSWTAGEKLAITGWTGGFNGTSGTSGQIFVGSTSSGLTASQLAQIIFSDGVTNYTATILSTGEVVPAAPTAVKLTRFNAASFSDGVQLTWESGFEVNNLGYRLYREQKGKRSGVTPSIVAGSALTVGQGNRLTAGYSYSWFDPQGTPETSYYLEAIDLNGERDTSGPIYPYAGLRSNASPKRQPALLLNDINKSLSNTSDSDRRSDAAGWPAATKQTNLSLSNMSLSNLSVQQAIAGGMAIKIQLKQSGWYRVTQPELVAAGLDSSADARLLQLFVDGAEVPVLLSSEGSRLNAHDTLEFYGVALDTPTTDTRTYWLINGKTAGKRINIKRSKSKGDLTESPSLRSFAFTTEHREKLIYSPRLLNGDADNIFGALIFTDPTNQTLSVRNFDADAAAPPQLEVALQGLTAQDHEVQVRFNGVDVGKISFSASEHTSVTFTVARSLLREGNNTVSLTSGNGGSDISFVDFVRLTYAHRYTADNNALTFSMPGGEVVRVGGFTTPNIHVVDITNPNSPLDVPTATSSAGVGYAVKVQAPVNDTRTLMAFADDLSAHPSSIGANNPSNWNAAGNRADLVIVTHKDFRQTIEPLAALRRSQGLSVTVVDVEDVYDEFSYGAHTPYALKSFLSWAARHWNRKPAYLLLVGDSSWDPRNYLNQGDHDFVPTKLIDTGFMETASDDWLVDFGSLGEADMAVGRLPGRTAAEISLMVSKIMAYEQERDLNVPLRGAVMVADTGFESKSADTRALLPATIAARSLNRADIGNDEIMRGQLVDALNQGPMIVNFYGHGSVRVWTGAGVLDSEMADNLTNANRPSIYTTMTCLNGYVHDAYIDSLSESLLKAQNGGAVAVWASSGFTAADPQFAMNSQFYRLLFDEPSLRLGEAARQAKLATADLDVRRTWMLLGDPTMRVR